MHDANAHHAVKRGIVHGGLVVHIHMYAHFAIYYTYTYIRRMCGFHYTHMYTLCDL
jgi:hypothetical protein